MTKSKVRLAPTIIAVVLAMTASTVVAAPGSAASKVAEPALSRFPAFGEVPHSSEIDAPVIAYGRITDTAGRPLAHAEVFLSAWASHAHRVDMPEGASFDAAPVARTASDADGLYELRVSDSPQLRARAADGVVDLEMNIIVGNRHVVHLTQASFRESGWVTGKGTSEDQVSPGRGASNEVNLVLDPESGSFVDPDHEAGGMVSQPRHHQPLGGCSDWVLKSRQTPNQTIVTAIASNGVSTDVTYTSSASTTSQTGISYNGSSTWSVNGSRSRSSTFTAGYNREYSSSGSTLNREYRVQWRHSSYERHCMTDWYGGYEVQVITEPDFATGGASVINSRYANFSCAQSATRAQVSWVQTENATATQYLAAFSAFGFSGGSRSGYNSATRIRYNFHSVNGGWWCGNNNYPAQAARVKAWR